MITITDSNPVQPEPSFEVDDTVSMSIRVDSSQVRREFVVEALKRSFNRNEPMRKWEYQLRDAEGLLHAGGAWFQEVRDGLCQTG